MAGEAMADFPRILFLMGGIQGVFITLVILQRAGSYQPRANRILAALLAVLTGLVFYYYLYFSGFPGSHGYIYTVSNALYLLLGPLFYLYVQNLFNRGFRMAGKHLFLFLPVLAELSSSLVLILLGGWNRKIRIINSLDHQGSGLWGYGLFWFGVLLFTFLCILAALRVISRYRRIAPQQLSDYSRGTLRWLSRLVFCGLFFLLEHLLFILFHLFGMPLSEGFLLGGYAFLAIALYLIGYWSLSMPQIITLDVGRTAWNQPGKREKYAKSALPEGRSQIIQEQLFSCMEEMKPHREPDVSLQDLAEKLEVSPHHLSQVMNCRLGMNFYQFINRYRLREVRRLWEDPDFRGSSLLDYALAAGFNSKTTFNRVVKDQTGLTPSEFLKKSSHPIGWDDRK